MSHRIVPLGVIALLVLGTREAFAQFNLPLPVPYAADGVVRENEQMLFAFALAPKAKYDAKIDALRERAIRSKAGKTDSTAYAARADAFCQSRPDARRVSCRLALHPDSVLKRFGDSAKGDAPLSQTLIKSFFPGVGEISRPTVGEYLRQSGGNEDLALASKFSANVGDNEAYVVTTVVRGLVGRTIFSADQALVVTRSDEQDPAKAKAIEGDKANALRAINNGGTLVGRFAVPMYVRTGATWTTALGMVASGGVLGAIGNSDGKRTGVFSSSLEWQNGLPVRALDGGADVLADIIVGFRAGYTVAGAPIRPSGGARDVLFGQMMVGLRQNGALSVSALVTVANHGMDAVVPRLAVNFAARR